MINLVSYKDSDHSYSVEGTSVPSMTQLMEYTGVIKKSDWEIPEKYAIRGTEIHAMTELVDLGLFDPFLCSDSAYPFIMQYERFLEENEVEILESETIVFNDKLFYAGRKDRLCLLNGKRTLLDIKSGAKARWHVVQLAGYAQGDCEQLVDLYLQPFDYKIHIWKDSEREEAEQVLEAMSKCYYFSHPRDYKKLLKIKEKV